MHDAAIDFVRKQVQKHGLDYQVRVLDIGGQRVSTGRFYSGPQPTDLFPNAAEYLVTDVMHGPDVDEILDATRPNAIPFDLGNRFDVVICTEVLEHVQSWVQVLLTARYVLRHGGRLILTCAGPGRRPHPAATEELDPAPGEFYANVSHQDLRQALVHVGYRDIMTYQVGLDTQATAVK